MRKKKTATKGQEAQAPADIQVIHAVRDGEWLAGAEFLAAAVRLADEQVSIQVDLEGMDYLDASSLQILLALRAGQKAKNRGLSLTRVSTALRQWFRYAGAEQEFTFD